MKRVHAGIALIALTLLLTACGSSQSGGASTASSPTSSAFLRTANAATARYLSAKGTFTPPPATAPKPQPGKTIALVSCGSTVLPTCGTEIDAAKQAATAMGWKTIIIDTPNGDPTALVPGIENAVADHVDGIFIYYVDCQNIRAPLEAAKKAGIPVVNSNGNDCSTTDPLFTYSLRYSIGNGSLDAFLKGVAVSQADYAISKLGGKAQVAIAGDDTTAGSIDYVKTVEAQVKKCSGCNVYPLLFPISAIGTTLQSQMESLLLKHPNINAVLPAYGALLDGGIAAALRATPTKHLLVNVAEGLPSGIAMIKAGTAQYGIGFSYGWEGYAAMDAMNRIFHHQNPSEDSGIGIQLFDATHNFPWKPPYNYQALYDKAWGVK